MGEVRRTQWIGPMWFVRGGHADFYADRSEFESLNLKTYFDLSVNFDLLQIVDVVNFIRLACIIFNTYTVLIIINIIR